MTNLKVGFYVVNAAGAKVEWYMDLSAALFGARRRPDGPGTIVRASDGAEVAAFSAIPNVSGD